MSKVYSTLRIYKFGIMQIPQKKLEGKIHISATDKESKIRCYTKIGRHTSKKIWISVEYKYRYECNEIWSLNTVGLYKILSNITSTVMSIINANILTN